MSRQPRTIDSFTSEDLEYLLSPRAVREKAQKVYEIVRQGDGQFSIHEDKLDEVVERVLKVTKENYPDLKIPFHSRWGHFNVGGVDRLENLDQALSNLTAKAKAKAKAKTKEKS